MLATKTRYTFADLLAQAPEDENIYDILGGELVVWSSPGPKHASVVMGLIAIGLDAERAGFGHVLTAPCAVAFDFDARGTAAEDVTHPDLLFYVREHEHIVGDLCLTAAPDLVVEVLSPTTRQDDLPGGRKFAVYERYAVPHYWIVDREARTIATYEWHDGRYGAPTVLRPGDTLTCPLCPGLRWDVATFSGGAA